MGEVEKLQSGDKTACDRLYSFMEHVAPFATVELNTKLFRRIIDDLGNRQTPRLVQLVEILIAAPLIRTVKDQLLSSQMSIQLLDVLATLIQGAKVSQHDN